jgi:hypothetical protein
MTRAGKTRPQTLTIVFTSIEALREFAETALDPSFRVYAADALDSEFSGNPGKDSWVLRTANTSKPDHMALLRNRK